MTRYGIYTRVLGVILKVLEHTPSFPALSDDPTLQELGVTKIYLVRIVMELEHCYQLTIKDPDWIKFVTVGDIVDHLYQKLN